MTRYVVRRCFQAIFVLLGVSVVVFSLMHLSGDPVSLMLPETATREQMEEMREFLGLHRPIPFQYARFLWGAVQGDFGQSLHHREPVFSLLLSRMPATIELALAAEAIALSLAVPLGVFAATRRNSFLDRLSMMGAVLGQSIPYFWLGLMLILVFSVNLRLLPVFGRGGPENLILPALTLATFPLSRTARMVRSAVLEVLGREYVTTARAKGLAEDAILRRHVLRNALIPVVTLVAIEFGQLLNGSVVVETVFAWPGVGRLIFRGIETRDFPLVQAGVFLIAAMFVLINLFVDLLYTWLDPRIRYT